MPKPSDIIAISSGLMNDSAQTQYTNTVCLPMFNLALDILQEIFEVNGLPQTTNRTSAPITIPTGVSRLGIDTTPSLPSDFIELQELWESPSGLNEWTPMDKRDFLPHYLEDDTTISQFLIYAWQNGRLAFIAANQPNDLKLDYIGKVFDTPILIGNINVNLPYENIKTFLEFETAALCAMYIAENPSRAQALESKAGDALTRSLGISVKGMQSVVTRRRPFRFSYKHRGVNY